jgi:hypothetical protein
MLGHILGVKSPQYNDRFSVILGIAKKQNKFLATMKNILSKKMSPFTILICNEHWKTDILLFKNQDRKEGRKDYLGN